MPYSNNPNYPLFPYPDISVRNLAPIAPLNLGDSSHISHWGLGGYMELPSLSARNALPISPSINSDGFSSGQRKIGMLVYVIEENKFFQLIPKKLVNNELVPVSVSEWNSYDNDAYRLLLLKPDGSDQIILVYDPNYMEEGAEEPGGYVPQTISGTGNPDHCWTELSFGGSSGSGSDTDVRALTAFWNSVYTTVSSNSATAWNYDGSDLKSLSANWDLSYSYVTGTSANIVLTNDGRLTNSRSPSGTAGGDLTGSYPNPTIKDSVQLAGQPTAPTAPAGTISNQIATTEFVQYNRGDKYLTTSTTEYQITTATPKTFTVTSSALAYTPTQDVNIVASIDAYMYGRVISYSGYELVVDIKEAVGVGTYHNWIINVGGLIVQAGALIQSNNLADVPNPSAALSFLGGVSTTRKLSAGTGLLGGGDLSSDRTFSVEFGTSSRTVTEGNDPRLSDSRTPLAHKLTHAIGGTDYISPKDIGAVSEAEFASLSSTWQNTSSIVKATSADWSSTFTTVQTYSAAGWDNEIVKNYVNNNFVPLTGGTIIGNLSATGSYYGDGSKLTGIVGDASSSTIVRSNSGFWQTGYEYGTAYSANSGTFAPYSVVDSISSQLVLGSDFNSYKTNVASATADLLPKAIYQSESTNWQNTFTSVKSTSANWNDSYNYVANTSANIVLTNDGRLTNSRSPSGIAGGDLIGSYPNPTIKDSVQLTGQPTAPTAVLGTNTTQIATTEFVQFNRGDKYLTTSTTSNTLDNVSPKTFVVASSGLSYTPTQDVTIVYDINNHMHGTVVSYSGYNLVVEINNRTGNGTHTNWTINVGGLSTQSGALLQSNNLSDLTNPSLALTTLGGVSTTRSISAGIGLTGGGDLTVDRTISVAFGNTSNTAVVGNDSRLSDARTPLAHKSSHALGGSDALSPSDIGAVSSSDFSLLSGNWNNISTIVTSNSAQWALDSTVDTEVRALTSNWNEVSTTFRSASSTFLTSETPQTLTFNEGTKELGITGTTNKVSLSVFATGNGTDTEVRALTGSFATNSTVNSVSSQLVLNSNFNSYKTSVASATAALLPTSTYQSASGDWQYTSTFVKANSAQWALDSTSDTEMRALSSRWQQVSTVVEAASSLWITRQLIDPTFEISTTQSPLFVEVGTLVDFSIQGQFTKHDAGNLTSYEIYENNSLIRTTSTVSNYEPAPFYLNTSKAYKARAVWAQGDPIFDPIGVYVGRYNSGSLYSNTINIVAARKAFFGADTLTSTALESITVRGLSNSLLNIAKADTFTIEIPAGTKRITFAYPHALGLVTSVKHDQLNYEVKGTFGNPQPITVYGADGTTNPIEYHVYTYITTSGFSNAATYTVTV